MAKTVMGSYSANEVIDQLRNQASGAARTTAPGPAAPPPPPYAAQRTMPAPAPPSPAIGPTQVSPYQPPAAPTPASAAPTMFAPGPAAPPQGNFGGAVGTPGSAAANARTIAAPSPFSPPAGGPYGAGPAPSPYSSPSAYSPPAPQPMPMPVPMPMPPPSTPPYLASTAARAGRPIEPWKDSLRIMMFVWGGLLLLAFATPTFLDPLQFNWDTIINGEGKQKLPPLIMAAVGLLSIVLALIPTSPAPRGLIAGVLGLAGILIPIFLTGMPHWKLLVTLGGLLVLIPGLILRQEYRDSILPRLLVTIGALAVIAQYVIPADNTFPIVSLFEGALEAPDVNTKIAALLMIAYIVVLVLTLLAWLPSPASGGAKVFAWIILLWPAVLFLASLALFAEIDQIATTSPGALMSWVAGVGGAVTAKSGGVGAGAGASLALGVSYAVLVGYGFATVIGKKLE